MADAKIDGESGSFTTDSGQVIDYTARNIGNDGFGDGPFNYDTYGFGGELGPYVGDYDGNETHIHTYSAPVTNITIRIAGMGHLQEGTGFYANYVDSLELVLDGVSVDFPALVASGQIVVTGGYEINSEGYFLAPLGELGTETQIKEIKINFPVSEIRFIARNLGGTPSANGFNYNIHTDTLQVVCFAQDTLIATDKGLIPVQDLDLETKVQTLDNGYQSIRWIGSRALTPSDLFAQPKLYPVRITAGALGEGRPERDLLVSRQHRLLFRSPIAERLFGSNEVLIPAIKLTALPGIYVDDSVAEVAYYHVLLAQHEIIHAEGALAESFFPGPEAINALEPEAREELLKVLNDLNEPEYILRPARPIPTGKEQKDLVALHVESAVS